MLSNIALDALIGMVPILGDLFDFAFKAQTRNLALLDACARHAAQDRAPQPSRAAAHAASPSIIVFATLTALGVWMLYLSSLAGHAGLGSLFAGL